MTVGDEPVVRSRSGGMLQQQSQTKITAQSAFAVAVCAAGAYAGTVAVGGRSPAVDIITCPGSVALSLQFR
jgi:hypothetical protein